MTESKFNRTIASGNLKEAIQMLIDAGVDDARLLLSRFNGLTRDQEMGIISYSDANIELNRIRSGTMQYSKRARWQTAEYVDDAIPSFNVSQAAPEHAPAGKNESAVSGLELLLAQPRLATVSQLPSLAARLTDVAEWLERFGESEFDDLASEVRSTARKAGKAPIQQQASLFTEAEELCAAVVELTLALREPTGTQAIINAGKASGSTEKEILAAAKAISKEKLAEVRLILAQGTNKVVARIQARKAL